MSVTAISRCENRLSVSDSHSGGNDCIDGSGSSPLSYETGRGARRAESVPGVHAMRRIVPNDVSPGEVAKLVCADNRRVMHVKRHRVVSVCRTRERLSPVCVSLFLLRSTHRNACTHLASILRGTTTRLDGLSVTHGEPPMDINNDFAKIKNSDTAAAAAAAAAAGAFTSSSQGVGPIRVQAARKRSSSDKCRIIAGGKRSHTGTRHCISSQARRVDLLTIAVNGAR